MEPWDFDRLAINQKKEDFDMEQSMNKDGTVDLNIQMQESQNSIQQKMRNLSLGANPNDNQIVGRAGVQGFVKTDGKDGDAAQIFPVSQSSAEATNYSPRNNYPIVTNQHSLPSNRSLFTTNLEEEEEKGGGVFG